MEYPGAPYSAGVYGRRDTLGQVHATAMHRLEHLGGFVVMGSTNLSEACMWMEVRACVHACVLLRARALLVLGVVVWLWRRRCGDG